jgi:hypothetical protein
MLRTLEYITRLVPHKLSLDSDGCFAVVGGNGTEGGSRSAE